MSDSDSPFLDFKPIDIEEFNYLVEECVQYSSQLLDWAMGSPDNAESDEPYPDPVITFAGLVRTYRKAAMSQDLLCDVFSQASPPGANVEPFASIERNL